MLEERDIRRDIAALALLVFVVFLGLALFTHSPADPSVELVYPFDQIYQQDVMVYPANAYTENACGRWGSWTSSLLFETFGLGAWYLVASLAAVTVTLLMGREIDSPFMRVVGWTASFVGVTTILSMIIPAWTSATVFGAGGSLGALGQAILRYYFADVGGFMLAASLLFGGLLLCTDYVLVHVGLMLGALTMAGVMGSRWPQSNMLGRNSLRGEDHDEDEYEDEEEEDVAVRVGGRTIRLMDEDDLGEDEDGEYESEEGEYEDDEEEDEYEEVDEEEDEYEDDEDEYEDEYEDVEPAPAKKSLAAKVAGAAAAVAGAAGTAAAAPTLMRGRDGKRRLSPFRVHQPEPEDREEVMSKLDEASMQSDEREYNLPSVTLLRKPEDFSIDDQVKQIRKKKKALEAAFQSFGYEVKVVDVTSGPVIAQYEIELPSGLRLSKITGLSDDIAIKLRVPSVRIVAPIPGKNTVGVEIPNEERQLVRLREVMNNAREATKKMNIPIFLGKDVTGQPLVVDLAKMPHLLIAGRTGTGKSVCLNSIIASMLMTRRPDEVRMLMIDPKMVELSGYETLPHLMHPVVTDMKKAEAILAWGVEKMEERYQLLAKAGVRHLNGYNQLSKEELMERLKPANEEERRAIPLHMPFIVIVADEMADLMMTAGKDVEQHIIRLAQKSRAVGIHLILATQKPTVNVITGLIKSNLPARIAFQVASQTDSRVVLDETGANKLLGNGDMLFLSPGTSQLIRGQGTFLNDDEINAVVSEASKGKQDFVKELVHLKVAEEDEGKSAGGKIKNRDDLYEDAIGVIIREGRGSCSLLQRALGIGYGRAARLIDFMAEDGIVGAYNGSQAREVLMTMADFEAAQSGANEEGQSVKSPAAAAATERGPMPGDDEEEVLEATTAVVQSVPGVTVIEAEEDEYEEDEYEYEEGVEEDEYEGEEGEEEEDEEGEEGGEEEAEAEGETAEDDDEEYEYEYEYVEVDEGEEDEDGEYEYEYVYEDDDAEVEEVV